MHAALYDLTLKALTLNKNVPAGASGRFWYVSGSGLVCSDGEKPEDFFLEFVEHGRVAIKGSNGKYLRGDQGGTLMADGTTIDVPSLWEY